MAEIESAIFIRIIRQKDHHWFTIEWSDGKVSDFHLSELQRQCPCARCRDERHARGGLDELSVLSGAEERPPLTEEESPPYEGGVLQKTGKQWIDPSKIDDDVTASRIISVGNYALQIFFTKGCSKGIYPFRLLRQMHHKYEI